MDAGAKWIIPSASQEVMRMLYFYKGESIRVAGIGVNPMNSIEMFAGMDVVIENGHKTGYLAATIPWRSVRTEPYIMLIVCFICVKFG